jgi:hypothetical protein
VPCSTWNAREPGRSGLAPFHVEHRDPLPEGPFGRDSGPTGPTVGDGCRHGEECDGGGVAPAEYGRGEAELGQGFEIPTTVGAGFGGLADGETAAGPQEADGALGGDGGGRERTGGHERERRPKLGVAGSLLGPGGDDPDAVTQAERGDRRREERGSALIAVEQGPDGVGPLDGQDQAGEAAAAPEVQEGPVRSVEEVGEDQAVRELRRQGAGPEEPEASRLVEDGIEVRSRAISRGAPPRGGGAPRLRTAS